jgi:endo-1,4-beta-xylanase
MSEIHQIGRRSLLLGGVGVAALSATGVPASASAFAAIDLHDGGRPPLWEQARRAGIIFGSSTATWQLDPEYSKLHAREAGLLFTEDDLLWYQLKPSPDAKLNFAPGDEIIGFAEQHKQLTIGAHLVWDEGFGDGWTEDDLWGLEKHDAQKLLYGVIRKEVGHYKGRMNAWIVANEVTDPEGDPHGFRTEVPWYQTIGPSYIGECFHLAKEGDPKALRVLNEFGFETVNEFGDQPGDRQRATLKAIDKLLSQGVPVQALGIQAHLLADQFSSRFHEKAYRAFLKEVADRGLKILITEMDVLDDGLPKSVKIRDRKVADVYRQYLDVTLDEKAVKALVCFGLSDRYTWLQEDQPREDGAPRRPLAFDEDMAPKPAYFAISNALRHAPHRQQLWQLKKG